MKKVLTIAGSDSSGGAGIQADLKTMSALGVYGMSVITAVTAQNTMGVQDVMDVTPEIVEAQIRSIFDDIEIDAVKIGMVSNSKTIAVIKKLLTEYKAKNIVLDPVMISKSGYSLLKPEAETAIKNMVGIADVITPNIPEAQVLTSLKIENEMDMEKSAFKIKELGAKNVLVKGGHRDKDADDILLYNNKIITLKGRRINTKNTHGTGCTISSAIASYLAKGYPVDRAVSLSKQYITKAIENSFSIGHGVGPVGHFIEVYKKADIPF
ncbi:bifunctional hydroxymethylpyrimidine kinase/phosphomethylpyrimidine kinase [Clostridium luticellarii]|jgi:hydroxymethylpyrimidine/phosphomethylpyrimidine kinase|uniref:Hydroxymethylpyrimidine/phosphomethylpyrimidine kinase n=1 Tax=Clostridium luticellarii TaxID=1691940 RepID=A0A2T0BDU0_9CLOT|nr:bifunctional hydroxymethylpyrimidine kinase/phosphomethylpyrimidine kinase [Clostridium luticellarii]MCI1945276.1 bifunctional hydroxymethylpyrimidine kinase/phosphomethylpyrimidine kinase [Clostridium luticellarii]MCI1969016.1 bifunctional hydroxymethylpyrimidine kinase/phosphomethylpyrimidine kinase [Clostridium luticellarii]MCI1994609.1 bifunctional hydroxymethylpyrimidine kinase/phosphomethylpyrimidine kinase [Clostridium luticellarii]MCI2038894.1 bifunctional hydroxymethylpyrimidine kin